MLKDSSYKKTSVKNNDRSSYLPNAIESNSCKSDSRVIVLGESSIAFLSFSLNSSIEIVDCSNSKSSETCIVKPSAIFFIVSIVTLARPVRWSFGMHLVIPDQDKIRSCDLFCSVAMLNMRAKLCAKFVHKFLSSQTLDKMTTWCNISSPNKMVLQVAIKL